MSLRKPLFPYLILLGEILILFVLAGLQATGGVVTPSLLHPVLLTLVALAIVTIEVLRIHTSIFALIVSSPNRILPLPLTRSVRSQINDPLII